jgi:hypothetical protein
LAARVRVRRAAAIPSDLRMATPDRERHVSAFLN